MKASYVIWGGYGGHNLGDEAILWSMSRLLKKNDPTATVHVLTRGAILPEALAEYGRWGINPVRFPSLRAFQLLLSARLVVGGGQLIDDRSMLWPVAWTSLLLFLNWLSWKRPLILFIGAEHIRRKFTIFLASSFYSLASTRVYRDHASMDAARSIGILQKNSYVARDVVFSTSRELLPKWQSGNPLTPRIAVVVSHDQKRSPGKLDFARELISALLHRGCRVTVVPHDLRIEFDLGIIARLKAALPEVPGLCYAQPRVVHDVCEIYANSDAVISVRMHALILGALSGAIPIAIVETEKVRSLVGGMRLNSLDTTLHVDQQVEQIFLYLRNAEAKQDEIFRTVSGYADMVHEHMNLALRS